MCKSAYCHRLSVLPHSTFRRRPAFARARDQKVALSLLFSFVNRRPIGRSLVVVYCVWAAMLRTHTEDKIVNRIWSSTTQCLSANGVLGVCFSHCRTNEQIALTIKILRNTAWLAHDFIFLSLFVRVFRLSRPCALLLPLLVNAFLFVDSQLGRAARAHAREWALLLISLHWDEISGMQSLSRERQQIIRICTLKLVQWWLSTSHDLVCGDHVTLISLLDCQVYCNSNRLLAMRLVRPVSVPDDK